MKPVRALLNQWLAAIPLIAMFLATGVSSVATATDLADSPLANMPTVSIRPNIAFVIDDSGSMDDENMPNGNDTNKSKYCYRWHKYNSLAYNPAQTYKAPIKADDSRYPDSVFSAALMDGYFAKDGFMYDGTTANAEVNLTSLGTGYVGTHASIVLPSISKAHYATSVKVKLLNGTTIELLNSAAVPNTSGTPDRDILGAAIADSINAKGASGFSASYNDGTNTLTIIAPADQTELATTPTITLARPKGLTPSTATAYAFAKVYSSGIYYATHKTSTTSTTCEDDANYNVVTDKSGIAAPGVATGSSAALTNYANWYSYYRKRAFLMKAGAGEAFAKLQKDKYRIGYFTINSKQSGTEAADGRPVNNDLKIDAFTDSHRSEWFSRLYGTRMAGYTPLRGALSRMGRMYAGKSVGGTDAYPIPDPVQYSCQRNYTILTTDGYWNTDAEVECVVTKTETCATTPNYGPYQPDNNTTVGDPDGAAGVTRPEYDGPDTGTGSPGTAANTLADVAYYYYHTDLRTGDATVCADKCENNVPPTGTDTKVDDVATHQHMTTFTLGLGVDGTLAYKEGYKTSTSGDYYDIKQGTKNWPNPWSSNKNKIDDLWHAAVNGRGLYLSARDPNTLVKGLTSALDSIASAAGSGAAAATSNLQPVEGDNYIYIANYRTVDWDGELSAYTITLSTGAIATDPTWQAANKIGAKIATAGNSDTRTIYTSGASGALYPFNWTSLSSGQKAYFDNSKLSQYADWSSSDKTVATPELLVNYLRGHHRYEDQDREDGFGVYSRLYRNREKSLGDIGHSQPVYVKKSFYSYTENGYPTFKTGTESRAGTVYVAANDGMLHAIDSVTGDERWAYVVPMVMKNLWRLADKNYSTNHRFFVDGPIAVSDVFTGSSWKTILVGGLGKGGRGYYALDITSPTSPALLWTFTADDDADMGYSYGLPMITKVGGVWSVLLPSGYNNIPETDGSYSSADGGGHLFVLNAADGTLAKKISTDSGSSISPSGLGRINIKVEDFETNNAADTAYGGDLNGVMWRFDLNAGEASKLIDLGPTQPITGAPEIGDVDGKTVIYFGTGSYLGRSDLDTKDTQAVYGIYDNGTKTVGTSDLVAQDEAGSSSVDWNLKFGWYYNLPLSGSGERVSLDPQLFFGTLIIATTIPTASECQPGGYGRLYFFDYLNGGPISGSSRYVQYISPIVGFTVAKLPGGTPKIYPITADGALSKSEPPTLPLGSVSSTSSGKRVMWRELLD